MPNGGIPRRAAFVMDGMGKRGLARGDSVSMGKPVPDYQRTSAALSSGYVIAWTFLQASRSMAKRLLSRLRRLSR